jgi:hypothetical protein
MDTYEFFYMLAYPHLYALYLLAVGSATSLFLFLYFGNLILQGKRGKVDESASKLSVWLNIMYPIWLDRLTYQGIVRAFVWALGLAAVSWTILAMVFLVVMAKVFGP